MTKDDKVEEAKKKAENLRGHHGKRWDYEPGEWYMGRHKRKK